MATPFPMPGPSRPTEIARVELTRLPSDAPLDLIFRRACELSALALNVERVGVWLFIDERTTLRCANLFEASRTEHSGGTLLRVADFPTYFASLNIRKAVPAEVASSEPWTAELYVGYLKPLGISSMLDAGIFVDGVMVGVVCHEHVGPPREWTTEARDFAGSVADLLALRIQSASLRELNIAFSTQRQRLAALEKNAALEQMAAGVAHDFGNLLAVVLGQGEILSKRTDVPADVCELGRIIATAAERGVSLVRELMEFAVPQDRPPAVIDLVEAVGEFFPVLQSAAGSRHKIWFQRPASLGHVLIGKTQFLRVLLNLIVNARDAMKEGGIIEIRVSGVKLTGDPAHTGRFVMLEVVDQGCGMEESIRRRVFEPFFSTKSKGKGLGLAIVRQIVERTGGLVRVESTQGKGSIFRVFFPRIGASSGETAEFRVPPELRGEGPKSLGADFH